MTASESTRAAAQRCPNSLRHFQTQGFVALCGCRSVVGGGTSRWLLLAHVWRCA